MALKFDINLVFHGENGEVGMLVIQYLSISHRDLLNDEAWLKGYIGNNNRRVDKIWRGDKRIYERYRLFWLHLIFTGLHQLT